MRSIVIEMITIGNSASDSPGCSPSFWLTMLIATMSSTTTVSTQVRRGTSNRRSFSR